MRLQSFILATLFVLGVSPHADPQVPPTLNLEGAWRLTSYLKADSQVRYQTTGYMLFTKSHWSHVTYFNRDPRDEDFAEAHHGTYRITGPDSLVLEVDIELHMDPKTEFQRTPVWYGEPATVNSKYKIDGSKVILDFASGAQCVIERIE